MVNGLYTAGKGMMLLQDMVDNTTNNLSNVNTASFKKTIASTMAQVQNQRNDQGLLSQQESHWMSENRIDWDQGALVGTSNPLDVAIQGNGFFQVATPDGVRYTRSGNFTRNGMGELVTLQGYQVLDSSGNPIQASGSKMQISGNGTVTVDGDSVGQLGVVDFQDKSELQKDGQNLYQLSDSSSQQAEQAQGYNLRQGYIEGSNVNSVESMVELIRFERNYDFDQKAVQSEDETLQKAVNDIGKVS